MRLENLVVFKIARKTVCLEYRNTCSRVMVDEIRKSIWDHFGKSNEWRKMSWKPKVFEFKAVDTGSHGRLVRKGLF